jgi:hypothetical protein
MESESCKEEDTERRTGEGRVVEGPMVGGLMVQKRVIRTIHQVAQDPIESTVRVAERNLSSKFLHLTIRNSCVWNASRNREVQGPSWLSVRRLMMRKDRLEWVISGLNQYKLTNREDQFIKDVAQDFNEKNMLTEQQEDKLENLYKEKSKLIPNKNYFIPKASKIQGKTRVKRPTGKIIP